MINVQSQARQARVRSSALWGAFGDALGFPTELADIQAVRRRIGSDKSQITKSWKRRVGGKFGANVSLPPGCYSDDTQLRLATSRACQPGGYFDVEAFAKVELPIWRAYSLGAGRGVRAAADNLVRPDVNWFSNFYSTKEINYLDSGGNGAAMRIQPHIWASSDGMHKDARLVNVLRNAITTHGNPVGFLGALFHGIALDTAIEKGYLLVPSEWNDLLNSMRMVLDLIESDNELSQFWLPSWELQQGAKLKDIVKATISEASENQEILYRFALGNIEDYEVVLEQIGGCDPARRGAGLLSAQISLALAYRYREEPITVVIKGANAIGSDTDTITTLAGSLIGAIHTSMPPGPIQDSDYILSEATRLSVSPGEVSKVRQAYEIPSNFRAPKTHSDAFSLTDSGVRVSILGTAKYIDENVYQGSRDGETWRWVRLPFGQSILAKLSSRTKHYDSKNDQIDKPMLPAEHMRLTDISKAPQRNLFDEPKGQKLDHSSHLLKDSTEESSQKGSNSSVSSLESASEFVLERDFDPLVIGEALLNISKRDNGIEHAVAFAAIVSKAYRKFLKTQTNRD